MVTYADLFTFVIMLCAVITLVRLIGQNVLIKTAVTLVNTGDTAV